MNVIIFKHFYFIDSMIFTTLEEPFNIYIDLLHTYLSDMDSLNFIYLINSSKITKYIVIKDKYDNVICLYI